MTPTKPFKPMLSGSLDGIIPDDLRYPYLASPKIDGVRAVMTPLGLVSRNLKLIRNLHIQECFRGMQMAMDGELAVGPATSSTLLQDTQSGVMSSAGTPDFVFHVFDIAPVGTYDYVQPSGFSVRYGLLKEDLDYLPEKYKKYIKIVPHVIVNTKEEVAGYEEACLAEGYEGVMLRSLDGPYKFGRATRKDNSLLKLKRYTDGVGTVVGIEEAMENTNEAFLDELGRTKRSKHQENMSPKGMIGKLHIDDPVWGRLVIGAGIMTHNERKAAFVDPLLILGKKVIWRSFGYNLKDAPRYARYYGLYTE